MTYIYHLSSEMLKDLNFPMSSHLTLILFDINIFNVKI